MQPKLEHVTGLAARSNGDYVTADASQKRVFLFSSRGKHVCDFSYIYKYVVDILVLKLLTSPSIASPLALHVILLKSG